MIAKAKKTTAPSPSTTKSSAGTSTSNASSAGPTATALGTTATTAKKSASSKSNGRTAAGLKKTKPAPKGKAGGGLPDISSLISSIRKDFGDDAITQLNGSVLKGIDAISTGALNLDLALGVGGVPRGRVVEIYGPESAGKTTLVSHIVANAQKNGGLAAFIDTEHALDPGYLQKIGVNLDELLVSQPSSGEEALNICESLLKTGKLDVIVVDSVAALAPKAELEGAMGDSHVGLQARLMSQAMRKLTGILSQTKTCIIFTNQIREKIGVMFGSPETTPGGRALKFYSSVRLDIRRIATLTDNEKTAFGIRSRVKVVKNKVAPPFRQAEFDILYSQGISWEGSIIDVATERDLIQKKGSWLSCNGEQLGQGREAAREALRTNDALRLGLLDKIQTLEEGGDAGSDADAKSAS